MYEIEFNQFTILKWWNMRTGNQFNYTVSTTHLKGSRLIVDFDTQTIGNRCLQWAGNQSEIVLTGNENPEDKMFTFIQKLY